MRRLNKEIFKIEKPNKNAPQLDIVFFKGKGNLNKKRVWRKHLIYCYAHELKKYNLQPLKTEMFRGVKITLIGETFDKIENGQMINYNVAKRILGGTFSSNQELKDYIDKIKKENGVNNNFIYKHYKVKNKIISYFIRISIQIEFYHKIENKNKKIQFKKY